MGNCTCRCFIKDSSCENMAKVIDSKAKLKRVNVTVKVAELMLEEPGYVVSPVEELKRTRRVVAMRAQDELLEGKVYVVVSIERVDSKVTDLDIAIIEAICSGKKRIKNGDNVLADVRTESREEESRADHKVLLPVTNCRRGNYKPWTPVLEPICEVVEIGRCLT